MSAFWIQTYTGKRFDIDEPKADQVCIEDIAHALSITNRFGGHSKVAYSVAQHSCYVADELPLSLRFDGLMHDAAEAYIGDISSPIKQWLVKNSSLDFKQLETRIQDIINDKFGLKYQDHPLVKNADLRALMSEKRDLMGPEPEAWNSRVKPFNNKVVPVSSQDAEKFFMRRFHAYREMIDCTRPSGFRLTWSDFIPYWCYGSKT